MVTRSDLRYASNVTRTPFIMKLWLIKLLLIIFLLTFLAACESKSINDTHNISPITPSTMISFQEGEKIRLLLSNVGKPDCLPPELKKEDIELRIKISDILGETFLGLTGVIEPNTAKKASLLIPSEELPAGQYRASYYVKTPLCTKTVTNEEDREISLVSTLSESAYWAQGDFSYQTAEPYREECCTVLQIILKILAIIILIGMGILIWYGLSTSGHSGWGFIAGLFAALILFGISDTIVNSLPGPLKFREHNYSVDWTGREVIEPNTSMETLNFGPDFDIANHMKAVTSSVHGYILSGEVNFQMVSSLVQSVSSDRPVLTVGDTVDILAVVHNNTSGQITADISLRCDDGSRHDQSATVPADSHGEVEFKDILLPEGQVMCYAHGKQVGLTILPKPYLKFSETTYRADQGEEILLSGLTNFSDNQQILVKINKLFGDNQLREISKYLITAQDGNFEVSMPTTKMLPGLYQILATTIDGTIRSLSELQLTKRFVLLEVQGINLPAKPIIVGDSISGIAIVSNMGNEGWRGELSITLNDHHMSTLSGEVDAQAVAELPFTFYPQAVGEQILTISNNSIRIYVQKVPWVRIKQPAPVPANQSFDLSLGTNLTRGTILTSWFLDGNLIGSEVTQLGVGQQPYLIPLNLSTPGVYLIKSVSSLDLGTHDVEEQVSIRIFKPGDDKAENALIYYLTPEPSDLVPVGREISVRLYVENSGPPISKRVVINVTKDGELLDDKAQTQQITFGNGATERKVHLGLLSHGYYLIEIDGRVTDVRIYPLSPSDKPSSISTSELRASFHTAKSLVNKGDSIVVNATVTNLTDKSLTVHILTLMPNGITLTSGNCPAQQCSRNQIIPPKKDQVWTYHISVLEQGSKSIEMEMTYRDHLDVKHKENMTLTLYVQ